MGDRISSWCWRGMQPTRLDAQMPWRTSKRSRFGSQFGVLKQTRRSDRFGGGVGISSSRTDNDDPLQSAEDFLAKTDTPASAGVCRALIDVAALQASVHWPQLSRVDRPITKGQPFTVSQPQNLRIRHFLTRRLKHPDVPILVPT